MPKKKSAKSKKTAAKKTKRPAKTARKKLTKKKAAPTKKKGAATKKKVPATKAVRTKAPAKKPVTGVANASRRSAVEEQSLDLESIGLKGRRSRSAVQSGDLQGISNVEGADSESVEELIEEGNAFEADVVNGVERAGDDDEQEVRTREVPEDDVPSEYLDEE